MDGPQLICIVARSAAYLEYFRGVVFLRHLVEELDDVGEVHVAVHDDVPVVLDEGEGDEEVKVRGDHLDRGPDRLPDEVGLRVGELAFEVQEKPSTIQ